MKRLTAIAIVTLASLSSAMAAPPASPQDKGKVCRVEQQCHWENFKKVCVYVKVCR